MTSWMKERDRLVEQTLAFVQGVAAMRPIQVVASAPTPPAEAAIVIPPTLEAVLPKADNDPSSIETDALISLMAQSPPVRADEPLACAVEPLIADAHHPIHVAPKGPPRAATRKPIEMALPERDVITQRVARFRAGQQKLIRERDANYAAVQAKIRATLGNDLSP